MKTIDLFSGCGGLSLGFQMAGFEILAALDNWKVAVDCYNANFNHPAYLADLGDYTFTLDFIHAEFGKQVEAIIGGPPCQDFSHAGKRSEGSRAELTTSFARVVDSIKPRLFVMENVDRALKSDSYKRARQIFINSGYGLTEMVLDASVCDVPQKRKRLFCIGILGANNNAVLPFLEHRKNTKPLTVREYMGDELALEHYYRHPRNYNRRGIFSIDEPAPTVRGVNRPVPAGYPGHHGDTTIITSELRALTTLERARLQTFPKDFIWNGSKTDMEQMIGNAVPVNLGKFIANSVNDFFQWQEKQAILALEVG